MHLILAHGWEDQAFIAARCEGFAEFRATIEQYPPERVAAITGVAPEVIVDLARRYATTKPSLVKFSDGIQRHGNGGQTVRALCCLPAVTGQYGRRGGGLAYSTSGYYRWDSEAVGHASECPPTPRAINMNRIGAVLSGEAQDPPIKSLFVFCANPVASSPNAGAIVQGLRRDDLFTVVHDLFMTDTADYADIVLPATSQLEQIDLHKAYGHRNLQYNHAAIAPLGEAKSNWDVMRLLAGAMGYDEPWLRESAEDAIRGVLDATRASNPLLAGITLERLQAEGTVALQLSPGADIPFADGRFPTPSGKVELLCAAMIDQGLDPLPEYAVPTEFATDERRKTKDQSGEMASSSSAVRPSSLVLISGASHHYVSSSMANQPSLIAKEGQPFVEINPADAAARAIGDGDSVIVESARGWCALRAVVTEDVPPGVAVAPKGQWARLSPDGRNINWTTSDALADLAGQSTFHSNLVQIRRSADM
jgi:anaerobic selenocysteine-containing dehydrogenase